VNDRLKEAVACHHLIRIWEREIRSMLAQFGEESAKFGQPRSGEQIVWRGFACQSTAKCLDEPLIREAAAHLKRSPRQHLCSLRSSLAQELGG
jgi:hypothetical protein